MSDAERVDPTQSAALSADATDDGAPEPAAKPEPSMRELVVRSFGGWWGVFDSAVPVAAFVIANVIGGLTPALWAGIGVAVAILVLRLVRRESLQQAISGFLGIAICVFIARQTGEAKGFFLLGIWRSALMVGLAIISVLVRWPLVGVIWELFDPSPAQAGEAAGKNLWRRNRALLRVYTWTTLVWGAAYAGRFVLEQTLYDDDSTGLLGVVRIAVGYPMLGALVGITFLAVRRTRRRTAGTAVSEPDPA